MTIQSELLSIKADHDLLTAEEVVDWARSHPNSALYKAPEFCGWDTKKAAYEHWLWGARRLIALHIRYEDNGQRKFVSLTIDRQRNGGGYRDIDDVLRDQSLYEIMLADALNELKRIERRYEQVRQLKPVWRAVAKIRRRRTRQMKGGERRASA
jgi:hypothetical protein